MSVATDLNTRKSRLRNILNNANTAITDKGGYEATNLSGIPEAISTIPAGAAGNLQEVTITPTGQEIVTLPQKGYDGFSKVTVSGDANLVAANIRDGVTIYGVLGTARGGGADEKNLPIPSDYQSYVTDAKALYTGDYSGLMILDSGANTVAVCFFMDDFSIKSYDASTTAFSMIGAYYCKYAKDTQTWEQLDYRTSVSDGEHYGKHIKFATRILFYGTTQVWPSGNESGGSGGSEVDQCEIYDSRFVPQSGLTYTAPVSGRLFYIGRSLNDASFTKALKCATRFLRNDPFLDDASICSVLYRDVSANETISFQSASSSSLILLAEAGAKIVDFIYVSEKISSSDGAKRVFEFKNMNRFLGFCCVSKALGNKENQILVKESDVAKLVKIEKYNDVNGWSAQGYLTGVSNKIAIDVGISISPQVVGLLGIKLSTSGTQVSRWDRFLNISTVKNYSLTLGTESFTTTISGYVIFAGCYRAADGFLLSGFTVLKELTTTDTVIGEGSSVTKTLVIAYKKVSAGDKISWNSTDLFGGTFFETFNDVSAAQVSVGVAEQENGNLLYPMPQGLETVVGISGFSRQGSSVDSPNVSEIVVKKDEPYGRLTTFLSNSFTGCTGESVISFPYTDWEGVDEDTHGIWAKFWYE